MAASKTAPTPTPQPAAAQAAAPALGTTASVVVAEGMVLRNSETGAPFAPGAPTPVTVTATVLRRLADGDLVLAA